jgi:hypothetical protein
VRASAASSRRISLLSMGSDRCGRTWVPLFDLLCAGGGEVGGGEHGQGDVSVPGPVTADLVVIESGFVLRGLEASSIAHLAAATRISSGTGVFTGPAQR